MNDMSWSELRGRLSCMLINEVRIFHENDLKEFDDYVGASDRQRAAQQLSAKLNRSGLDGDLRLEVARLFEKILAEPVHVEAAKAFRASDINQWSSSSAATTMESPLTNTGWSRLPPTS